MKERLVVCFTLVRNVYTNKTTNVENYLSTWIGVRNC